jgi:20S proteasome subunit beta 2
MLLDQEDDYWRSKRRQVPQQQQDWDEDELDMMGVAAAHSLLESSSSNNGNNENENLNSRRHSTAAVSLLLNDDDDLGIVGDHRSAQLLPTILSKNNLKKTGTTIAGCCMDGHVILAADTRATENTYVADKACQKLHPLSTNAWCAGAGTSADLDHLTKHCLYSMALQQLQEDASIGNTNTNTNNTGRSMELLLQQDEDDEQPRSLLIGSVSIDALCHFLQEALYDAKGQLGANLILGGVWRGQAYLRAIHPHGSMDVDLPFCALGSGGLAAMGVLEKGYRNDLSVEDGIALVQRAIVAGIRNDLGSGSQVDLCVIAPDGTSRLQRCVVPEEELEEGFRAAVVVEEEANKVVEGDNNLGVNGFGNLPFAVQSKKVLLASAETAEEERLARWNELLGLKEADNGR